jgi:hypothetical protein
MKYLSCFVALCATLPLGCSSSKPEPVPAATPNAPPTSRVESTREVSTVAVVQSVDQDSRTVTLKNPKGDSFRLKVDDRVKNLSQLRPGDRILVTYTEALAVQVVKKGEGQEDQAIITEQAQAGEKPGGSVTKTISTVVEVLGVDQKNGSMTLRTKGGEVETVYVRHPERLSAVRTGDHLWIKYTEGVAVSVEPASAEVK